MSYIEDLSRRGYKVYREHTTGIDLVFKNVRTGLLVTDQSDTTGKYTTSCGGDEACWAFWNKGSRAQGAWSLCYLAIMTAGGLLPVKTQALGGDSTFALKTVVTTPVANDHSKVQSVDGNIPAVGDYGLVVQGISQDAHEQIFIPISSAPLKVDWLSGGNLSNIVYGVTAGGELDPANYGTLKDFLKVYDNFVFLLTDSGFYLSDTRNGALNFEDEDLPAILEPSTPANYPVHLAYDGDTGLWTWYCTIDTSSVIIVDNTTIGNTSTHLYGATAGGEADPANVGHTKDIMYVDSNCAYIPIAAGFRYDGTKNGSLEFTTATDYPASIEAEGTTAYAVKLAWEAGSPGKWKWYTKIDATESTLYAVIRWNVDITYGDFSEGELYTYDPATNVYTASGTAIWIDFNKSLATFFETAGTATIFQVKKIKDAVTRNAITRNLYMTVRCVQDLGSRITHMKVIERNTNVYGTLLSSALSSPVWVTPTAAMISTTILTVSLTNKIGARVPAQWDLSGAGDYLFVELSDASRGLPWYFRPVSPILSNRATNAWESKEQITGTTIATYLRTGVLEG